LQIEIVRTEGLGDSTYVLTHDGVAVVVDPQRDIDRFQDVLNDSGAGLRYVLETHLHNDYISGGRDLAKALDGELVLPSGAAPVFRHRPAFHYEDLNGGALTVRPIHTPGHTPEHMSYLILIDDEAVAVFTGGSLLVGSAGRSDLLGLERADTLARLQYGSVNRLAELGDEVGLYPTHGAGSFCTTSGVTNLTSTIGEERTNNPVLAYPDEDSFVEGQLSALVPYPSYYAHMGPANVAGRDAPKPFTAPTISATDYAAMRSEVSVVDARPKGEFAAGHLAGSFAVEMRNDFSTWVGWVLPFNAPLVLVMSLDQDTEEALRQLSRIGFDDVSGVITDLGDWDTELSSYALVNQDEFASAVLSGAQILDVRAPNEREAGFIADSSYRYVPDIAVEIPDGLETDRPLWVACETGYRANLAASILESEGHELRVLVGAGVTDVLADLSNRG
jgi:glyoxylase-like metal-dependent hydrolase (beta-lactamase superfamily II)/rhodanese-related sulfurtransferase